MALYNDFRPGRFSELVGNERLVKMLISQVQTRNFHHAYLMHGQSGVGKTTTARLLAATLCCTQANGTGGCGVCSSCKSIRSGSHWDVLEIDGARFRGVDDAGELAQKARLYPLGGRKVYILDECHMLSNAAWSVLLKLMEEPPDFLTMLFCTTDLDKIPKVVQSRCCVCHFDTPTNADLQNKLRRVCRSLSFDIEQSRLLHIQQAAKGNFRAAENLLEQAYAEHVVEQLDKLQGNGK